MTWGSDRCPHCGSQDTDVQTRRDGWDAACFACGKLESWRKGQYQWNGGQAPKESES